MDITQQGAVAAAPDAVLGSLGARLRRARIGFVLLAIFGGVELLIGLYSAWFYLTIAALGHEHGWGNIPPQAYPVAPDLIQTLFNILDLTQRGAFIGAGIAFLYGLTQHRRSLEAVIGGTPFKYGWGWSIGSLFIPFWNLYRPWVGFAEVRRAAFGIAARQRASLEWQGDGFSAATLVLGLGYCLGSGILQGLAQAAGQAASTPTFSLATIDIIAELVIADVVVRSIQLALLVWYLRSIDAALRKIDTSFLIAGRFD